MVFIMKLKADEELPKEDSLEYAGTMAKCILDQQLSSIDSIINRATIIIGISGIFIGIIFNWDIILEQNISSFFFLYSIIGIIITITLSLYAMTISGYSYILKPKVLWNHTNKSKLEVMMYTYSSIINSYETNGKILGKKALWMLLAMVELFTSVVTNKFLDIIC